MKKNPVIRCVYRIDNPFTGEFYIGSTDDFYRRKRKWADWKNSCSNRKICADFEKYGFRNFVFTILEKFENGETIRQRLDKELEFIHSLRPQYNTIGFGRPKEVREKIRKKLIGIKQDIEVVEKRRQSLLKKYKENPPQNEWSKKKVIVDGREYASVKEACAVIGCTFSSLRKAVKKGRNSVKGHSISYTLRRNSVPETKYRTLIVDGVQYKGYESAAVVIGCSKITLFRAIGSGKDTVWGHSISLKE